MNKRIFVGVLLVIIVGVLFYLLSLRKTTKVGIEISGTFEAKTIDLSVPVPSKVISIYVNEGELVNKDDTLVVLDTTDLSYQIQALKENIQSLQSKIKALDIALGQLQRDLKRIKTVEKEAVPVSRVEKMEAELQVKERERQALLKQIESLRRQVDRLHYQFSQLMLLSPVDGIVQTLYYDVGEFPKPGFPIVTIVESDSLEFQTYIPQTRLLGIHTGDTVEIIPDAYPSKTLTGIIKWIGEEAEYTPRNLQTPDERIRLVYPVKVHVPNSQGEIKSGMTGVMRWVSSAKRNNKS